MTGKKNRPARHQAERHSNILHKAVAAFKGGRWQDGIRGVPYEPDHEVFETFVWTVFLALPPCLLFWSVVA